MTTKTHGHPLRVKAEWELTPPTRPAEPSAELLAEISDLCAVLSALPSSDWLGSAGLTTREKELVHTHGAARRKVGTALVTLKAFVERFAAPKAKPVHGASTWHGHRYDGDDSPISWHRPRPPLRHEATGEVLEAVRIDRHFLNTRLGAKWLIASIGIADLAAHGGETAEAMAMTTNIPNAAFAWCGDRGLALVFHPAFRSGDYQSFMDALGIRVCDGVTAAKAAKRLSRLCWPSAAFRECTNLDVRIRELPESASKADGGACVSAHWLAQATMPAKMRRKLEQRKLHTVQFAALGGRMTKGVASVVYGTKGWDILLPANAWKKEIEGDANRFWFSFNEFVPTSRQGVVNLDEMLLASRDDTGGRDKFFAPILESEIRLDFVRHQREIEDGTLATSLRGGEYEMDEAGGLHRTLANGDKASAFALQSAAVAGIPLTQYPWLHKAATKQWLTSARRLQGRNVEGNHDSGIKFPVRGLRLTAGSVNLQLAAGVDIPVPGKGEVSIDLKRNRAWMTDETFYAERIQDAFGGHDEDGDTLVFVFFRDNGAGPLLAASFRQPVGFAEGIIMPVAHEAATLVVLEAAGVPVFSLNRAHWGPKIEDVKATVEYVQFDHVALASTGDKGYTPMLVRQITAAAAMGAGAVGAAANLTIAIAQSGWWSEFAHFAMSDVVDAGQGPAGMVVKKAALEMWRTFINRGGKVAPQTRRRVPMPAEQFAVDYEAATGTYSADPEWDVYAPDRNHPQAWLWDLWQTVTGEVVKLANAQGAAVPVLPPAFNEAVGWVPMAREVRSAYVRPIMEHFKANGQSSALPAEVFKAAKAAAVDKLESLSTGRFDNQIMGALALLAYTRHGDGLAHDGVLWAALAPYMISAHVAAVGGMGEAGEANNHLLDQWLSKGYLTYSSKVTTVTLKGAAVALFGLANEGGYAAFNKLGLSEKQTWAERIPALLPKLTAKGVKVTFRPTAKANQWAMFTPKGWQVGVINPQAGGTLLSALFEGEESLARVLYAVQSGEDILLAIRKEEPKE